METSHHMSAVSTAKFGNNTAPVYLENLNSTESVAAIYVTIPSSLSAIYFIIAVLGFCLNIFTITIIVLHKPMHKYLTNILIINQSILDATAAAFLFFSTIYQNDLIPRTRGNFADEALCRIWF